jgi:pterin-4a-carbinolamine dehydratase
MSIEQFSNFSFISRISLFLLLCIILINNTLNVFALAIKNNDDLFPPNFIPYGFKFESWIAKWSQWSYSIPSTSHPAYDYTGELCSQNQSKFVWFLIGTFGYPVVRECTIPFGTAILFPILNTLCTYADSPHLKTKEQLKECASNYQNHTTDLKVTVDGEELTNIMKYRIQSEIFNYTLPINNVLNVIPQFTQGIADGYWIFLKPLSLGKHEIRFSGNTNFVNNSYSFSKPNGWNYETIYNLNIISEPLPSTNSYLSHIDIKNHLNKIRDNNPLPPVNYIGLNDSKIKEYLKKLPGWGIKNNYLYKSFKIDDYGTIFEFAFNIAERSQIMDHHANITTSWGTITVASTTFSANAITHRDIDLAKYVEGLYQKSFSK